MVWPLQVEQNKRFLYNNGPGSFWENRNDRYHCGIDLYAPQGTNVLSIADGTVLDVGVFTDSLRCHYWNKTYYVLIAHDDTLLVKYAEMGTVCVDKNDIVKEGDVLGTVGLVLNAQKITDKDPLYIRKLGSINPSMLHLEVYEKNALIERTLYSGGNWFGCDKPSQLKNPYHVLKPFLI